MKTRRIKRSVLAGALTLAVLGSQSMEILTASAASEELEYEGTTQVSSTDYYPAFDTTSTALEIEEVYVEAGSSVQEGDAILKLTEDSYQSALDYYQAAIIRATNDLTNEELAYAQGMQSAEYELELALADEEQAEFVQEQSEAELSDTIEEHEEVLTEMEERIEDLENGEYDTEEEAEEGMSASAMSGSDASGSGMSGSGGESMGNASGEDRNTDGETEGDLPGQRQPDNGNQGSAGGGNPEEEKNLEGQIAELENEAESLQADLEGYQKTLKEYLESESKLESEIKESDDGYYSILEKIYELFGLEEAELVATSAVKTESALESAEEPYEEPEVIEEPQAEEPQIEEPQEEEPQAEEPQVEEPQAEEPAEIYEESEDTDNSEENEGSNDNETNEKEDQEEESETETEEWDGMFDPEHPEKGGILTVQISGGTITLEIPENAFTEAVSLQIDELTASYEALVSGAVDAEDTSLLYAVLNKAYENREGTWEDTNDQIYDFYVLDLTFVNQEGAVVEPAAAIQVTVDHSAAPVNVDAAQADPGNITEELYRISPAGGAAETVGSQIGLINNGISFLSFTADSFSSPYVVLMIEAAGEEETETESVTEDEEAPDETEELISTLSAEEENEDDTEDEKEEKYEKLQGALQQLYSDLENKGVDELRDELKDLIYDLETGNGRAKILVSLNSLFKQLKDKEKSVESLDEAKNLVDQLAKMELEHLDELVSQLQEKEEELYDEYYNELIQKRDEVGSKLEEIIKNFSSFEDHIEELEQTAAKEGQDVDQQIAAIAALEQQNETLQKEIEELSEAASAGSALTGMDQEAAENAAAGLTDETDLSALAGMSGMSGMSGMDASSMANMSDTEALQLAEEELAAGLGEGAVSDEGALDVQSILGAQESESMFGDKYDLTQAKALLERKATDDDEAEELLDDLYPMRESVQLDYEELLRLRKPLKLEIRYQYDETLFLARLAEITYDKTTKELEEELRTAQENLLDLEEELQELEDLEDGTVRAAASGTLSAVYYEAEDTLFALYPMYSIYDTDTVTVLIAVPQSEIARIAVGEEVEVSLSGFGNTQGTVTEKAVEAQEGNPRTTVNYEVEISIDNSSGRLSSGTAVTVTVAEA